MRSSQSITVIRSSKYRIAENEYADMHGTALQYENKLIHQHDFITIGINEAEVHHIKPSRIEGSDSMEYMTTLCIPHLVLLLKTSISFVPNLFS